MLGLIPVGSVLEGDNNWISTLLGLQSTFANSYKTFNDLMSPVLRVQVSPATSSEEMMAAIAGIASDITLISFRSVNFQNTIISKHAFELINGSCNSMLDSALTHW